MEIWKEGFTDVFSVEMLGRRNDPVSSSLGKTMHGGDWETKRPRFVLIAKEHA